MSESDTVQENREDETKLFLSSRRRPNTETVPTWTNQASFSEDTCFCQTLTWRERGGSPWNCIHMNDSSLISIKSIAIDANFYFFFSWKVENVSFLVQLRISECCTLTSFEQNYPSEFKQVKNFSQRAKSKIDGNSKSIPNPFLAWWE